MRRITILILTILLIVGCVGEDRKPTVLISQPSTSKLATADVNNAQYLQGYTPANFIKQGANTLTSNWSVVANSGETIRFGNLDVGVNFGLTDPGGTTILRPYPGGDATVQFCGTGTMYCTGSTDVAVADGGTGRSSATAYMPIVGGTTSTSAFQSVATSGGTSYKPLMYRGTSTVPTWSSSVYPDSTTSGGIIYASGINSFTTSSGFTYTATTGILDVQGSTPRLTLTDTTATDSDYGMYVDGNASTWRGGTGNIGISINGNTGIYNFDATNYAGIINLYTGTAYGVLFGANKNDKIGFYNGTTPVIQPLSTRPIDLLLQDLGLRGAGNADANFDKNMLMQVPWGAMWMEDGAAQIVIGTAGVYYDLNSSDFNFDVNSGTFTKDGNTIKLNTGYRGKYLANWSASVEMATNAQEIEGVICANNAAKIYKNTVNTATTGNAGTETSVGGTGVILINDGDKIDLCFENETGTNDIEITHANLTLTRIWRHVP